MQSGATMSPILAVDVQYRGDDFAVAAGGMFRDWAAERFDAVRMLRVDTVAPYRPGAFFERELPCILALLADFGERPGLIVIDGFVRLGAEGRDGLGAHLFHALCGTIPVIGVAKTAFRDTPAETAVWRGNSERPLHVTAIGIAENEARRLVASMHGAHRMPTLLKAVDRACRDAMAGALHGNGESNKADEKCNHECG